MKSLEEQFRQSARTYTFVELAPPAPDADPLEQKREDDNPAEKKNLVPPAPLEQRPEAEVPQAAASATEETLQDIRKGWLVQEAVVRPKAGKVRKLSRKLVSAVTADEPQRDTGESHTKAIAVAIACLVILLGIGALVYTETTAYLRDPSQPSSTLHRDSWKSFAANEAPAVRHTAASAPGHPNTYC